MFASTSTSLLTDTYELTILDAALKNGIAYRRCTFELSGHRLPATRRFDVTADTGHILGALGRFEFDAEQVDWLHDQGIVSKEVIQFLASWRFTGGIWGYAKGEYYFPGSPLLIAEGTFADCMFLETLLLSILNHDCVMVSATSCITVTTHGRPYMDIGARHAHECVAVSTVRAAIIGGLQGISDLEAAKCYNIRCIGTVVHALTLLHDIKRDALDSQVARLGTGMTLLMDAYDIRQGVINTVEAARAASGELGAVRLDSGDLVVEMLKIRGQFDAIGTTTAKITVISDLDEYAVTALGAAPMDSYGVGTKLVTGSGVLTAVPVYKVVQCEGGNDWVVSVVKKAESKSAVGGHKAAGRAMGEDGYVAEELLFVGMSFEEGQALLAERGAHSLQVQLIRGGQIDTEARDPETLFHVQEHRLRVRNELPYQAWRLSEDEVVVPTHYEQAD